MLYEAKYKGFNMSHFTEYLNEEEGMVISRETVRRILRTSGVYDRKARRRAKHRCSREPMAQEGQMTQMDTSFHLTRDRYLSQRSVRLDMPHC